MDENLLKRKKGLRVLKLTNIHHMWRDSHIYNTFRLFGRIEAIYIDRDDNGKSRGIAYVLYYKPEDASAVCNEVNEKTYTVGDLTMQGVVVDEIPEELLEKHRRDAPPSHPTQPSTSSLPPGNGMTQPDYGGGNSSTHPTEPSLSTPPNEDEIPVRRTQKPKSFTTYNRQYDTYGGIGGGAGGYGGGYNHHGGHNHLHHNRPHHHHHQTSHHSRHGGYGGGVRHHYNNRGGYNQQYRVISPTLGTDFLENRLRDVMGSICREPEIARPVAELLWKLLKEEYRRQDEILTETSEEVMDEESRKKVYFNSLFRNNYELLRPKILEHVKTLSDHEDRLSSKEEEIRRLEQKLEIGKESFAMQMSSMEKEMEDMKEKLSIDRRLQEKFEKSEELIKKYGDLTKVDDIEVLKEIKVQMKARADELTSVLVGFHDKITKRITELEQEEVKCCVVCHDRQRDALCLPCKHLAYCLDCAKRMLAERGECFICRGKIESILQIVDSV